MLLRAKKQDQRVVCWWHIIKSVSTTYCMYKRENNASSIVHRTVTRQTDDDPNSSSPTTRSSLSNHWKGRWALRHVAFKSTRTGEEDRSSRKACIRTAGWMDGSTHIRVRVGVPFLSGSFKCLQETKWLTVVIWLGRPPCFMHICDRLPMQGARTCRHTFNGETARASNIINQIAR
jgi:hypothetical protein